MSATPDLREYFAAERTLLAYVRTALAMIGIGFVLARFSLMLRMLPVNPEYTLPLYRTGFSRWLGITLVLLGAVVNLIATFQYGQHIRLINGVKNARVPASWLGMAIALSLGALGVLMALYLAGSIE